MVKRKQKQLEIMFTSFQEQDLKKKQTNRKTLKTKKRFNVKQKKAAEEKEFFFLNGKELLFVSLKKRLRKRDKRNRELFFL